MNGFVAVGKAPGAEQHTGRGDADGVMIVFLLNYFLAAFCACLMNRLRQLAVACRYEMSAVVVVPHGRAIGLVCRNHC